MAEQVILTNDIITVAVSLKGAELQSIKKDGQEFIWCGDPAVWGRQAPHLFPICGKLNNGAYTYEGKEYKMEGHGFARFSMFEVESLEQDKAVLLLRANDETRKSYPFEFEFRVVYTLVDSTLKVEYKTTNVDTKPLYYSVGGHDGYACPEGVEAYKLVFEKPENLDSILLKGVVLSHDILNFGINTTELDLKDEYFKLDTLIFKNLNSKRVWLKNKITGAALEVRFDDFDNFMVWTIVGAKYICLEPWCGLPDYFDAGSDITKKAGIIELAPGKTDVKERSVTV